MELDNSATSFIIIILTLVTVAYVVYTNYNDILDIKNKLQKLLEFQGKEEIEEEIEEEVEALSLVEGDCLLSKEWEKDIPIFLPAEPEYVQLEEIFEVPEETIEVPVVLETIAEVPEEIFEVPAVPETIAEVPEVVTEVKPVKTVSIRRRKTKQ